jgi:hypothetical protein
MFSGYTRFCTYLVTLLCLYSLPLVSFLEYPVDVENICAVRYKQGEEINMYAT